jgi:RNA polymerase-binding transcription factor DksA
MYYCTSLVIHYEHAATGTAAVPRIQANESREVGLATRELLMERVKRLSAALDRMSEGACGTCVECGDAISAARLRATPEVQTCVRCQDGIERVGRHVDRSRHSVFGTSEDRAMAAANQASIHALYRPSEDDRDVQVPGALRSAVYF